MPYQDVPAFLADLRDLPNSETTKLALEFLVLTAVRSGEMRGARWSEIDVQAATWMIPGERMKAGRPHTVPLAPRPVEILERMAEMRVSKADDALVFPGAKPGRPMSDMTLTMLLRRAGAACTAHGFRSSFRDRVGEATGFPSEIAELCLAHTVGSAVERAYRRSDLFEKRAALMEAWSGFCTASRGATVVPLRRVPALSMCIAVACAWRTGTRSPGCRSEIALPLTAGSGARRNCHNPKNRNLVRREPRCRGPLQSARRTTGRYLRLPSRFGWRGS